MYKYELKDDWKQRQLNWLFPDFPRALQKCAIEQLENRKELPDFVTVAGPNGQFSFRFTVEEIQKVELVPKFVTISVRDATQFKVRDEEFSRRCCRLDEMRNAVQITHSACPEIDRDNQMRYLHELEEFADWMIDRAEIRQTEDEE